MEIQVKEMEPRGAHEYDEGHRLMHLFVIKSVGRVKSISCRKKLNLQ